MPTTPAAALGLLRLTATLRTDLLATLSDDDLGFAVTGNPTLGEVLADLAATERAYIGGFRTGEVTFGPADVPATGPGGVERMRARFQALDAEFEAAIGALSDAEFRERRIDHGDGYVLSMGELVHTWIEALVIVYGKIDVYLRAMGRSRSEQWVDWIG